MTIRHNPLIIMYQSKYNFRCFYLIDITENYSSIREVCRRGEFDNLYSMVKRRA